MSDRDLLRALLRNDLSAFIEKCFGTVSPGDEFLPNWHVEAITHELGLVLAGERSRLLITQPPRTLKSICVSVAFVAWAMGHDPRRRFICVSYSQDLAEALARQFRAVVESSWYRELFPAVRLRKCTEAAVETTLGGGRLATSTGGTLTGRGADFIIIDDPMKAADAHSETERQNVIDWYRRTLSTRLNNKKRGAIITVMQRLHEDDLAGHLLETNMWGHLNLPAEAVDDERVPVGTDAWHTRRPGDLLHPEREGALELERIKRELGSLAYSAQYQQEPVPAEGNLVKREWFQFYEPPLIEADMTVVQSWDIAGTVRENSDYSVCLTWGILGRRNYLLDVWRGRLEYPDLRRRVIFLQNDYEASYVLIEAIGLGLSLAQDLRSDAPQGFPNPIERKPKEHKVVRMTAQSAIIEAGHVWLPKEAPWLDVFLKEVMAFPNSRHDDQVDAISQFLEWSSTRPHNDLADGFEKGFAEANERGRVPNPFRIGSSSTFS